MNAVEKRRRLRLLAERDRAIVNDGGIDHPEFASAFMRYYLPHYMTDPVSGLWVSHAEWHPQFFGHVFTTLGQGVRDVHIAPRGFAKTTIGGTALTLSVAALKLKQYVWLMQKSHTASRQALEGIMLECTSNPRLLGDFPHLKPMIGGDGRAVADRDDDVVLASGLRIQAVYSRQPLRGRKNRQYRPDLLIVDDLEDDDQVATKFQRDKTDSWLASVALGALAPEGADVHILGTILHHDAVLARLRKRDPWQVHTYFALRDKTDFDTSTWPAYWTRPRLEAKRVEMGARAFNREFLHVVIAEDEQMFKPAFFQHRRVSAEEKRVRIGVDPATGSKSAGDYSTIVVCARARGSRDIEVLDAWRRRGLRGKQLVEAVKGKWQEYGGIVIFESVQAQEWGKEALEDEGVPVSGVKPHQDKQTRAEPVANHYENGRVWHAEHLEGGDFEEELETFPVGDHDDYVDALVYAVKALEVEPGGGVAGSVVHSTAAATAAEEKERIDALPKGVHPDDPRWA